jgi:hypothetical protein
LRRGRAVLSSEQKGCRQKGLDRASGVQLIYVLYMACHKYRARTSSWPWAWPLRADLNKGSLMVELAWERILNEDTGLRD